MTRTVVIANTYRRACDFAETELGLEPGAYEPISAMHHFLLVSSDTERPIIVDRTAAADMKSAQSGARKQTRERLWELVHRGAQVDVHTMKGDVVRLTPDMETA